MNIACQTITFGEEQNRRFPAIFETISDVGYTGVEIGFRHIEPIGADALGAWLNAAGLRLVATHLGGNLYDANQADGERQVVDGVMDFLAPLGTRLIMYSGLRFRDRDQFERDMADLNQAATRCAERGFRLLYHNHNWEFADGERVMSALLTDTDGALGFCPDVGWVDKAGTDVLGFLDRVRDRVGAVHFKDFAGRGDEIDTVELGDGVVPLGDVVRWMQKNGLGDLWAIAEQDRSALPAEQAVRVNSEYLQSQAS